MRGLLHIRKAFGAEDRGVVDADGHLIAEFYHHVDENYFEDAEANAQEYVALRAEVERLREALRFYADEDNWHWVYPRCTTPVVSDNGERARKALTGEECRYSVKIDPALDIWWCTFYHCRMARCTACHNWESEEEDT